MSNKPDSQSDRVAKLEEQPRPRSEGFDPYSTATAAGVAERPRRTLDDMRKLSEEIKRSRAGK